MRGRQVRLRILTLLTLSIAPPPHTAPHSEWPVERIIANLEARLAEAPEDANTLYDLGRVHAFAFAQERTSLSRSGGSVDGLTVKVRDWRESSRPSPDERLGHLGSAVRHLRRAAEIEPQWAHRHLTLAWILETGAHLADRFDATELFELTVSPLTNEKRSALFSEISAVRSADRVAGEAAFGTLLDPARLERAVRLLSDHRVVPDAAAQERVSRLFERYWIEQAIEHYRTAFQLAIQKELQQDEEGAYIDRVHTDLVSWEAGPAFLRLARSRGLRDPGEEDLASRIEAALRNLQALPIRREPITPLLLSVHGCKTLDELIAPELAVPFDLDGDGVCELWPWIAPEAGWLVWDPERRGEITSGRQLFGTASGWFFFPDGYHVLDALDDDRSGELRGPELAGIAVWFDRDTDGISDRGEVLPVEELGIVALATRATELVGRSPANPGGLELADGRVLPTYDWVLEAVSE